MSRKFMKRMQGSVSIFLTIILVPMLSVCGVIVDGARIKLANSNIASAGDLSLNAGLATYDTVLKDAYGLFAVSQTTDELQENLYNYFANTLMANGIISDESEIAGDPILAEISNLFSGASNTLSMEVSEDDFTYEPVKGSSLASTEILKNQIVEYEKYRAPLNAALSMLDGIKAITKIFDQAKVTEAKVKTDEAAGEVSKSSSKLYDTIKDYVDSVADYSANYRGDDSYYKTRYINNIMPQYLMAIYSDIPNNVTIRIGEETVDGTTSYSYLASGMSEYKGLNEYEGINSIMWYDNAYNYAQDNHDEAYKNLCSTAPITEVTNEIKSIIQEFKKEEIDNFKKAQNFLVHTANDNLVINDLLLGAAKSGYKESYKIYMQKINYLYEFIDVYNDNMPEELEEGDVVLTQDELNDVKEIMEEAKKVADSAKSIKVSVDTKYNEAYTAIGEVKTNISGKIAWFSNIIGKLDAVIAEIEVVKTSVNNLNSANTTLENKINSYDNQDSFSSSMTSTHDYYEENIDIEKLNILLGAVGDIKTHMGKVKTYFESIKICDKSISEISNVYDLETVLGNKVNEIADNAIDKKWSDISEPLVTDNWSKGTPVGAWAQGILELEDDEFYKYLKQNFGSEASESDKTEQTDFDAIQNNADGNNTAAADTSMPAGSYTDKTLTKDNLPSYGDQNTSVPKPTVTTNGDGDKNFSSMFTTIKDNLTKMFSVVGDAIENGRDNLYISEYVFDNFTYCTEKAEKELKGEDQILTSGKIEKNETNNYFYGAEVEYVVYGNLEASKNVSSALTTIFGIRFIANSVFALSDSEINTMTLSPALAVQAATAGIVPYKLVQVVIELCLALAESAIDMAELKDGKEVVLVKSKNTWNLSPSGAVNTLKDMAKEKAEDLVANATDEVKGVVGDLINAGTEKIQVTTEEYLAEMRTTIEGQLQKIIDNLVNKVSDTVLEEVDDVINQGQLVANQAGAKADEIIGIVQTKVTTFISSQTDAIQPILNAVYDNNIKKQLDDIKTQLTSTLEQINSTDASSLVSLLRSTIFDKMSAVLTSIERDISGYVYDLSSELGSELSETADGYIDMGADKILETTNGFLDSTFDSLGNSMGSSTGKVIANTKTNSTFLDSVLKFSYRDYLGIFLYIELCKPTSKAVARIGDLIQLNVSNGLTLPNGDKHKDADKFLMKNAYTYISVEAEVKLKAMFLNLPTIMNFGDLQERDGFVLKYKGVMGY